MPIALSTCFLAEARQAEPARRFARAQRDDALRPEIQRVWARMVVVATLCGVAIGSAAYWTMTRRSEGASTVNQPGTAAGPSSARENPGIPTGAPTPAAAQSEVIVYYVQRGDMWWRPAKNVTGRGTNWPAVSVGAPTPSPTIVVAEVEPPRGVLARMMAYVTVIWDRWLRRGGRRTPPDGIKRAHRKDGADGWRAVKARPTERMRRAPLHGAPLPTARPRTSDSDPPPSCIQAA